MALPAPTDISQLDANKAAGERVYSVEYDILVRTLQALAGAYPDLQAAVNSLLLNTRALQTSTAALTNSVQALPTTVGGVFPASAIPLLDSSDLPALYQVLDAWTPSGVFPASAMPLLDSSDLPALYQVLDAWALSRGLSITTPTA